MTWVNEETRKFLEGIVKEEIAREEQHSSKEKDKTNKERFSLFHRWSPRDEYHFVDIGSGIGAERVYATAEENLDWYILGIDKKFNGSTRMGNIDLINDKVHKILKRLKDHSIRIANSDYFLFHYANSEQYDLEILKTLSMKLIPNGILYFSHRREVETRKNIIGTIKRFGFEIIDAEEIKNPRYKYSLEVRTDLEIKALLEKIAEKGCAISTLPITQDLVDTYLHHPGAFQPIRYTAKLVRTV